MDLGHYVSSTMISAEANIVSCSLVRFADHFMCHFCEGKMADMSIFTVEERLVAAVWVHKQSHTRKKYDKMSCKISEFVLVKHH